MSEFVPVLNVSQLDGTNGFRLDGAAAGDASGTAVAGACDANDDGLADLLIGAPFGSNLVGSAYVVFGTASSPAAQDLDARVAAGTAYRFVGRVLGDETGYSVASAGDVNGDGIDDILIGAALADGDMGASDRGETYLVFGGDANLQTLDGDGDGEIQLGDLTAATGYRFDGEHDVGYSGGSVAGAGDVNGDGVADLIIGAYSASVDGGLGNGASYVIFGGTANLAALDDADGALGDGAIDLANLSAGQGISLIGDTVAAYGGSGISVSLVGDVDGDGFGDAMIGEPGLYGGAAYLLFGRSNAVGFPPQASLADVDGVNLVRFDGVNPLDATGVSVSGAGDVNGDGLADMIIGAPFAETPDCYGGAAYVVFGRRAFSPTVALSGLNGSNGFRLEGVRVGDLTGAAVVAAGDVNGDGFADLAVSAPNFDRVGAIDAGSVYIVFGKASGFAAQIDLGALNGSDGFRVDGAALLDGLGYGLGGAGGDVNGDGFDDIIAGAPGTDFNGYDSGSTYVIYGQKALDDVVRTGTAAANRINGGLGSDEISGLAGNDVLIAWEGDDTVNGGGGRDSLSGGDDDDTLLGASGNDTMDGGAGDDRIVVGGGADFIFASAGEDTISGGSGTDRLDFRFFTTRGITANLATGLATVGLDTQVLSSIDWVIGTDLADTMLGNNRNNGFFGQDGNDILRGAGGNDFLDGGRGNDTLTGGHGFERFAFNYALDEAKNLDTIVDFSATDDAINLNKAIFTGMPAGALAVGAFNTGAAATEADDRIVYNAATGALIFDADGDGIGAAIQFARLTTVTGALSEDNFFVV